jgi:anti-sigma regulatory factor (Ser/Thr protein kinase)
MLQPEARAVATGRRFVSATLARWGYPDHAETASLLVSEIATNAVRHARTAIELRIHRTDREIVTEITDDSTHLPQRRLPSPDEENGRGLMLVDVLASSWGTRPTQTGKIVWFVLTTDQAERH